MTNPNIGNQIIHVEKRLSRLEDSTRSIVSSAALDHATIMERIEKLECAVVIGAVWKLPDGNAVIFGDVRAVEVQENKHAGVSEPTWLVVVDTVRGTQTVREEDIRDGASARNLRDQLVSEWQAWETNYRRAGRGSPGAGSSNCSSPGS